MRYTATCLLLATVATVHAQSQSSRAAAFEVASIKVNDSGDENFGFTPQPGGLMHAVNVTARQIVTYAYSMQNSRVEGGPDWLDAVRYDVTAKAAEAATPERMLLMLRALLTERFNLAMHLESRDTETFALVRVKAEGGLGPQLRASSVDCDAFRAAVARGAAAQATNDGRPQCAGRARPGFITAGAVSMEELARNMSRLVGRVVVDRTGLPGRYDFDLKFVPDAELTAAKDPALRELPSLYVALEEQLGLKLETQRSPVEVVVIDSIQPPTRD